MEYMVESKSEEEGTPVATILCCECGVPIEPNPANMCVACLRSEVDITDGIPKQGTLYFCKQCERYLQPPAAWVAATLESRELLSVCLKRIKGLNKEVRLVDAGFIWTEPHSKRIKVKLTIQKEVMNGAVLQQVFVVEFVVHNQMCDDCHRVEAQDFWRACVQIRQKIGHKRTIYYLEQAILKHKAHQNTSRIKASSDGLDFFYAEKQGARKLVEFLQVVVPCRYQTAQELISHDIHNNTYNYKNTFSVEIVPVCKDNIVCLPRKLAQQLGNLGQICICYRVTQTIHLIDPNTLQIAEVSGTTYWRSPFQSVCGQGQLIEFIIMDINMVTEKEKRHVAGHGQLSQKHGLAEAWVVRASEIGTDEQQIFCRTHLGHILNIGDTVLGFDFTKSNVTDQYYIMDSMNPNNIPDVLLVKKSYDRSRRHKKRQWKLQHLEDGDQQADREYTDFLEDLEEDPAVRKNVNIYRDHTKIAVESDTDDDDIPRISLQEMLDDLHISEDATGVEGAEMQE